MAKSLSIDASLVIASNKITMWIKGGKKPVPLRSTPPLSVVAVTPLNFALVGDGSSLQYHVFTYRDNGNGLQVTDLGPTGHPYDPKRPKLPRRVDIRLVVQGKEIVPMLGERKRAAPRSIAQVMDLRRPISFGIVSNTSYWVACNQNDRTYHLYSSDGLGSVADLGSLGVAC